MVNVYVSASNLNKRGGGESDWYGILNVDPLADYVTVKKQYKKPALLLHPDKNKFNGAKEAFNLVFDAWNTTKEANAEEAEWLFKNRMKRANENSTDEEERLFKRPALMKTGNSNCSSEAERLFKKPMKAANPNSTLVLSFF
ncbi:hypothetical protein HID58_007752 [Brassica napus]|uniref:J domain-containing protein n=1 Tax=Brassica napus TaxID=3708 RepID=A0ABQ7WY91_BRANA|nr:hypothetical protein HID58_091906 [Brassica napus]KAH0940291.1 hypothetical protein HID58_007752 [Brassica napus]